MGKSYLKKIQHAKKLMSRKFNLGLDVVMERKDCKNFRVTKTMLIVVVKILMKQLRTLDAREV